MAAVVWNQVSNLPDLLRRQKDLYKRFLELEREIADLDRQIIAAGTPVAVTHRATRRASRTVVADGDRYDYLRPMLRALRDAAVQQLSPREVASLLGVEPEVALRWLANAVGLGYVEHVGDGLYRVTDSVRSVPGL